MLYITFNIYIFLFSAATFICLVNISEKIQWIGMSSFLFLLSVMLVGSMQKIISPITGNFTWLIPQAKLYQKVSTQPYRHTLFKNKAIDGSI